MYFTAYQVPTNKKLCTNYTFQVEKVYICLVIHSNTRNSYNKYEY